MYTLYWTSVRNIVVVYSIWLLLCICVLTSVMNRVCFCATHTAIINRKGALPNMRSKVIGTMWRYRPTIWSREYFLALGIRCHTMHSSSNVITVSFQIPMSTDNDGCTPTTHTFIQLYTYISLPIKCMQFLAESPVIAHRSSMSLAWHHSRKWFSTA